MRVHIGSDHAGFELKTHLIAWLDDNGYEAVDHGAETYDAEDDYPPFCIAAAAAAVGEPGSLGGRHRRLGQRRADRRQQGHGRARRARLEHRDGPLARQHNDAKVVAVGARMHTADEATAIVETFLTTPWSHAERHQRRIDMIALLRGDRQSSAEGHTLHRLADELRTTYAGQAVTSSSPQGGSPKRRHESTDTARRRGGVGQAPVRLVRRRARAGARPPRPLRDVPHQPRRRPPRRRTGAVAPRGRVDG